jgi:formylglycine-generating enzyme
MARLPGGSFVMGAAAVRTEEGPARVVNVAAFRIDRTDVTNAQFGKFVEATGYRTLAERGPAPASLVFVGARPGVSLADPAAWWRVIPGADWRHPEGPGSSILGRENLPVVHVAYEDALAYAHWLGHALPTEAEWEYAARGGWAGARYVWGNEQRPSGRVMANTWQGRFPDEDLAEDGYRAHPSPVGCFPPNGFWLYDMAGNVWQWTSDLYPAAEDAGSHVIKGGSFLCSDNYCYRYRPAARTAGPPDSGASHIGFRTVVR